MISHRVNKADTEGYIKISDGIWRKTLVYGVKTLLTEFILVKGKVLPMHRHPEEQTGYLVSGNILLTIDGVEYGMEPGDSWAILGDVEHGAEIMEDAMAIEIFSPCREDYLEGL